MTNTTVQQVAAAAWRIRRYALRMGEVQGQGYIGQALGYADVLATAFAHGMTFRAQEPEWEGRDRFLLSHGHYAIAYYAALIEAGLVPEEELETYGSACRCPAWQRIRPAWRSPAVLWGRDSALVWEWRWG